MSDKKKNGSSTHKGTGHPRRKSRDQPVHTAMPRAKPTPLSSPPPARAEPILNQNLKGDSTMYEEMPNLLSASAAVLANAQQANLDAAARTIELLTSAYARLWGMPTSDTLPADKRFADDAWKSNPAFDALKQAYLINSQWLADCADTIKDIDPELHHRAVFYTRQFANALSPANFPFTNPTVLEETVRTGGASLVRGMQNLVSDALDGKMSQVPTNAFKLGKDLAATPGKVIFRNKLIELIQYAPSTRLVHQIPLLMIAPWINKYYVLDLRPQNSMIKFLVDSGFTVFAISWKNPDGALRDLTWEDYMTLGPLDAVRVIKAITGTERVNMVGYCAGGLLLETIMAYWAAKGDPTPNSATYLAVHQDFDNVGDLACFISPPEVMFLEWLMSASGGYLDGKNMGAAFDLMRSNDLIWNYVVNNYWLGKDPPAFDILAWNSDTTRVPEALHSWYLRTFFLDKKLTTPNALTLLGEQIDLGKITTPTFALAMKEDHIVPWKSAFRIRDRISGPLQFTLAESGHIAGVINPPAAQARGYWCEDCAEPDPEAWLTACASKQQGSWWTDWAAWLDERSSRKVSPPAMGSPEFPPLEDAPGTYVFEK